jgi:hypothetical protein
MQPAPLAMAMTTTHQMEARPAPCAAVTHFHQVAQLLARPAAHQTLLLMLIRTELAQQAAVSATVSGGALCIASAVSCHSAFVLHVACVLADVCCHEGMWGHEGM